jgi:hypothetical protein
MKKLLRLCWNWNTNEIADVGDANGDDGKAKVISMARFEFRASDGGISKSQKHANLK